MHNIWVTKAEYYTGYKVNLEFNDGTTGMVDLKDELEQPVFEPLKDVHYFRNFKLNSWTIEWRNGADFAPEFLYERVMGHVAAK